MEITIISAENLCMNGKPLKDHPYVVVHTQSCTKFFTTRMPTQEEGGSKSTNNNPSWNDKFRVDDGDSDCITLEVQCKTWFGVRSVGAARIAVADFAAEKSLQLLSYRLWDGKGRRNGVINFSVRVVEKPAESESLCSMHEAEAQRTIGGNDDSRGIVTGIPVFWNYPLNIPRWIYVIFFFLD